MQQSSVWTLKVTSGRARVCVRRAVSWQRDGQREGQRDGADVGRGVVIPGSQACMARLHAGGALSREIWNVVGL